MGNFFNIDALAGARSNSNPLLGSTNTPAPYDPQSTNLGGYTPAQRQSWYGSNPSMSDIQAMQQSTGVPYGAMVKDYNALMGGSIDPVSFIGKTEGWGPKTMGTYMRGSSPSELAGMASKYGLSPANLTNWYNNYYGTNITPDQAGNYLAGRGLTDTMGINIPTHLFPTSSSSSHQSSQSWSGIDWDRPLAGGILSDLLASAEELPEIAESLPDAIYNQYSNLMRESLGPQAFQGTLNELAAKGMIDSSVASDALSKAAHQIQGQIGQSAYDAMVPGLMAQMDVPGILGQLASLDRINRASSSGSSSSSSSNPLAPYSLMANIYTA